MSLVVCGIYPSVNAAYRAKAKEINVTRTAVYNKLNGVELSVSAALVRETATQMAGLIEQMGGKPPVMVCGYQTRILDGNCLAATDHRLEVLRDYAAKALPGKSLVVLNPDLRLVMNVFPCEDGYTQERSLFAQVLATVEAGELWIADRSMCTLGFLFGVEQQQACFLIREHKTLPKQPISELQSVGKVETGEVFEQMVSLSHSGQSLIVRRVVLRLLKPTRDGDTEIAILTSLPPGVASATVVVQLYRERWTIETLFQTVTENFEGELRDVGLSQGSFVLVLSGISGLQHFGSCPSRFSERAWCGQNCGSSF